MIFHLLILLLSCRTTTKVASLTIVKDRQNYKLSDIKYNKIFLTGNIKELVGKILSENGFILTKDREEASIIAECNTKGFGSKRVELNFSSTTRGPATFSTINSYVSFSGSSSSSEEIRAAVLEIIRSILKNKESVGERIIIKSN